MDLKYSCKSCKKEKPLFSYQSASSPYCECCLLLETILSSDSGKPKPLLWKECISQYANHPLVKKILDKERTVDEKFGMQMADSIYISEPPNALSSGHRGNESNFASEHIKNINMVESMYPSSVEELKKAEEPQEIDSDPEEDHYGAVTFEENPPYLVEIQEYMRDSQAIISRLQDRYQTT